MDGQPLAGYTQASDPVTGTVYWCFAGSADPAPTFTPSASGTGYPTFYYGEIDGGLSIGIPSLGVFPSGTLAALGNIVGGLQPGRANAVFFVYSMNNLCAARADMAGWTITLQAPDGTDYPDGSYDLLYLSDQGVPSTSLTATSGYGVAFATNIDPSLGNFVVPVYTKASPGACTVQNRAIGFSGRLYVSGDDISEQGVFLP